MAGPGSRLEKVGTIFSRVQGLLRSGALKETEKPIWCEVYAAFPPRGEQKYEREPVSTEPVNILYREDHIRAKFYQEYGNPEPVDMHNNTTPSISHTFIDKYMEILKAKAVPNGEVFQAAAEALKSEGFRLKTKAEIQKEQEEAMAKRAVKAEQMERGLTEQEVFGTLVTFQPEEAEDTLDESILNPDTKKDQHT